MRCEDKTNPTVEPTIRPAREEVKAKRGRRVKIRRARQKNQSSARAGGKCRWKQG
ncbi:hypothetical protein DPMN_118114 [Dreissena polymorpha]|uniref:Uncharacterized protein n=1 Tax=Dreissena polymorpha TaxID=45954 RepID=A0A9D4GJH1_DREPO|nr:hypothetical protein DPMN_118114 [Dreissena polymorpha]